MALKGRVKKKGRVKVVGRNSLGWNIDRDFVRVVNRDKMQNRQVVNLISIEDPRGLT